MSPTETPERKQWVVSASPHLRDTESTPHIMWSVVAALAPAGAWSIYLFGWAALYVIALCVATAVAAEGVIQKLRGLPITISDGSAVVTGLLLAYCLPSHSIVEHAFGNVRVYELKLLIWQVPVIGAVVAIAIAKHCFGGLGHNIWNPALVGRAFVQLAFAEHVSLARWPWPAGTDAVTKATALSKSAGAYSVGDAFVGNCPGSLGEVSALLLLLGAVFLMIRQYVDWRLPLGYALALVAMATLFAWSPGLGGVPWVNNFARVFAGFRSGGLPLGMAFNAWLEFAAMTVFSGGVMLGALYMATDMVTSPLTHKGQFVYGLGCGVLTALIRSFAGYPEGVCYSILLMNTVRPYVDQWTRQRIIGEKKERAS